MSDLNYRMPGTIQIPIGTLERAAEGEKKLRDAAQAVCDAYSEPSAKASAQLEAMNKLRDALKDIPA